MSTGCIIRKRTTVLSAVGNKSFMILQLLCHKYNLKSYPFQGGGSSMFFENLTVFSISTTKFDYGMIRDFNSEKTCSQTDIINQIDSIMTYIWCKIWDFLSQRTWWLCFIVSVTLPNSSHYISADFRFYYSYCGKYISWFVLKYIHDRKFLH